MNNLLEKNLRSRSAAVGALLGVMIGAATAWASDGIHAPASPAARIHGVQVAELFGESDEEKAARLQREDTQDSTIATLKQRVDDLENSLRRVTGQVEELDHRLDQANQHIVQMQKDFDYKLCNIAAQQLGASPESGDQNALPCGGQQQSYSSPPPPQNTITGAVTPAPDNEGAIHLTPPPPSSGGVLGTMPATAAPPPAAGSPALRKKFDTAMNLLARAQYDEASAAFRNYADSYPQDDLAPQAVYWVGDIAYVQKDYAGAARAFAETIKKYPTSPRGPDSMLKLGQSLIAMNQKKEGCTTLAALPSKYPNASKAVNDSASAARKAAACH
ncbi:MAG TPA: tol-pal system protein YbgF [Rhizomicrobium sp.]|nr:tol-pal system protein YbgF [Rhizomicrobium sp.]